MTRDQSINWEIVWGSYINIGIKAERRGHDEEDYRDRERKAIRAKTEKTKEVNGR